MLCEFGADVDVRDETGNTPLLVACSHGHYDCVVFLVQSAADLTAANTAGQSALHLAAWDGSAECVEILAEYGVDPLVTNALGLTALANVRTRSPLRHKFKDLVREHPIRRALDLLEDMEREARVAIADAINEEEDEESEGSATSHEQPKQRGESVSPTKHVTFVAKEPSANQPGEAQASKTGLSAWTVSVCMSVCMSDCLWK